MKHAKQSDNSGMIEDVDQRSGALHSTCPLGPWLASQVRRHQTNQQHEAQIRTLQGRKRPINVLSTNSAWLLSSLVLGCNGLLSGSVVADLQARLYRAVKANDRAEACRLNNRIYPAARVFSADPLVDMHNRMEALVLLGKLPRAVVRPPLVKISDAEIARIRNALIEAGLLRPNRAGAQRGMIRAEE